MVKLVKLIKVSVLLNVCITTCQGKPYYRFINLLYCLLYRDVIYHKPTYDDFYSNYYSERAKSDPINTNYKFTNKIESVQYNDALAITGCVRGTSREKLFLELGLTSLYDRRRLHRLTFFHKILNDLAPQYLIDASYQILFVDYKVRVQIVKKLC